jgi:hypothetical protein
MKRLLLILLFIFLFATNANSAGLLAVTSPTATGGASCPATTSPDMDADPGVIYAYYVDGSDTNWNGFATSWTVGGADVTICRVGFRLNEEDGNVDAVTYNASILTATYGAVANGVSDDVSGSVISATQDWVYFNWTGNKPILTASTTYVFVVHRKVPANDASNCIRIWGNTADAGESEDRIWLLYTTGWAAYSRETDIDMGLRIYYYD